MRTRLALPIFLALTGVAAAQVNPLAVTAGSSKAPRFYGLTLDLNLFDYQGVNFGQTYGNDLANSVNVLFDARWNFGRVFLRNTRMAGLGLSLRFSVTGAITGYDPSNYSGDLGIAKPCSDLQVSQNGSIDPNQVKRCQTPRPNRVDYSDLGLWLRIPVVTIPKIEVPINAQLRVGIPVSAQSRAESRLATLGGLLSISKTLFKGKLTIGYNIAGTKFFHKYQEGGLIIDSSAQPDGRVDQNYQISQTGSFAFGNNSTVGLRSTPTRDANGNLQFDVSADGANNDFSFTNGGLISVDPIDQLNFSAIFSVVTAYAYELKQCEVDLGLLGGTTDACANAQRVGQVSNGVGVSGRRHADLQNLWISTTYTPTDWINFTLALSTSGPLRRADNSYRPLFFDTSYNQFTQVTLGATLSIDHLAGRIFKDKQAKAN